MWIQDFVLDLAATDDALNANADLQVVLPTVVEPLLASGLRG